MMRMGRVAIKIRLLFYDYYCVLLIFGRLNVQSNLMNETTTTTKICPFQLNTQIELIASLHCDNHQIKSIRINAK